MMDKVVHSELISAGGHPTASQSIPLPTNILIPPLDSSSTQLSSSTILTPALLISSDIERLDLPENSNILITNDAPILSQEFMFDMTQVRAIEPVMIDDSEFPTSTTESILTILDELDLMPTIFQANMSRETPTIPITLDHISVVSRSGRSNLMILSIFRIVYLTL